MILEARKDRATLLDGHAAYDPAIVPSMGPTLADNFETTEDPPSRE